MKLIPFVFTQKENPAATDICVVKISVFLDKAGRSLWQTDEPVLDESAIRSLYLEPNGLYAVKITIDAKTQTAWIHIDATKTRFADFYSWEEALQHTGKPECWRTFYYFLHQRNEELWSPQYIQTPEAEISGLGNVHLFFQTLSSMNLVRV